MEHEFLDKLRRLPRFTSPKGVLFPAADGELVEVGSVISLFRMWENTKLNSLQQEIEYRKKYESFLMSVARSKETWEGTFDEFVARLTENEALPISMDDTQLQVKFAMAYWFVKRYYATFLIYHNKHEDISHNDQYFMYADANSIIGKVTGKSPNGAPVEVEMVGMEEIYPNFDIFDSAMDDNIVTRKDT